MIRGPKKSVTVLLPMELYEKLRALSLESCRTLSSCIRQILKQYIVYREEVSDGPNDRWIVR